MCRRRQGETIRARAGGGGNKERAASRTGPAGTKAEEHQDPAVRQWISAVFKLGRRGRVLRALIFKHILKMRKESEGPFVCLPSCLSLAPSPPPRPATLPVYLSDLQLNCARVCSTSYLSLRQRGISVPGRPPAPPPLAAGALKLESPPLSRENSFGNRVSPCIRSAANVSAID